MSISRSQRVVWSDGLLVTPQHFQRADLYHEHLLHGRIIAQNRWSWGVGNLEMDREALRAGQVRLRTIGAVLPDGCVLDLRDDDPELPASREIENHFPATSSTQAVYLALPHEREGARNYLFDQDSAPVRYQVVNHQVPDMTEPSHRVDVALGQRRPLLLFGDEPLSDYTVLKIAEVVRDDMGGVVYSDTYIPPCLHIGASPFILERTRAVLRTAVKRREALTAAQRHSSASSIEFSSADVTRFLLLNLVNGLIPTLQHWLDSKDMPPREVYLGLSHAAGQLCTFSMDENPAEIAQFQYTDLRATFEPLLAQLTRLLLATVEQHYIGVDVAGDGNGLYRAELSDRLALTCDRFVLGVQTDLPPKQVSTQLPSFIKIATHDVIEGLVSTAMPGAPVEVTFSPPREIPVKSDLVYFTISSKDPHFQQILEQRKLAIYLPPFFDPQRTTLTLMGVLASGSARVSS